jgi:cell division protein FtsQ
MENQKNRLQYMALLIGLCFCALILIARLVYFFMADPAKFPINKIQVSATYEHISHQNIEAILTHYLNASFFSLPVGELYAELSNLSWCDKVTIQRIWPDTLKINLTEKKAIAIWNNALLTPEGTIFHGEMGQNDLPQLSGPLKMHQKVLQVYEKLSKILSMYHLHAAALHWRENQAWELSLTNGLSLLLGKQDLEHRLTRFCRAYPAVFAEQNDKKFRVDLRYPHGMAVQWQH